MKRFSKKWSTRSKSRLCR